jgi:hypothetical protein
LTRGVIIQALELHIGLKMQTKRLLDDREVFAGDKLFDAQGRSYALVELSSGELVVVAGDGRPLRFKPDELGCFVIHVNRTERGLAKERLRDFEKTHRRARLPSVLPPSCISHLSPIYKRELG